MIFDPFGDYETRGYLRNHFQIKDVELEKALERISFRDMLPDALGYLAAVDYVRYEHFLKVHDILLSGVYPWAGQDRILLAFSKDIRKGSVTFAQYPKIERAVTTGLDLAQTPDVMRVRAGEVRALCVRASIYRR